jgi:ribonuclease VapC
VIVADTSAIIAIVFAEPEREAFVDVIRRAPRVLVSTVSVVEARMVVHGRRGERAVVLVDDLLRLPMFELIPPGIAEMDAAYAAFVAFGKGSDRVSHAIFARVFGYERGDKSTALAVATIRSVALGVIGIAFIQAILVGLCLLAAGVP